MKLANNEKAQRTVRRRWRVRARVKGTAERPRLCVHFSNRHIYAQCIDDGKAITLAALSTRMEGVVGRANMAGAGALGDFFAQRILEKGINKVVFDRGPRRYHGCVKSFADAARAAGVEF